MNNIKKILWLALAIVFASLCSRIANAQSPCQDKFHLTNKDTAFTTKDYTLLLLEPPTKEDYEITVTFKKKVIPVVVTAYDNQAATYTGTGWTHSINNTCCGWYQNSLSYSNVIGNTISFTFTGIKIEWFTEKLPVHGRAAVQVDGLPEEIVILSSSSAGLDFKTGLPAFSKVLPMGVHTIKILVAENKNIVHDFFRVTR